MIVTTAQAQQMSCCADRSQRCIVDQCMGWEWKDTMPLVRYAHIKLRDIPQASDFTPPEGDGWAPDPRGVETNKFTNEHTLAFHNHDASLRQGYCGLARSYL